MILCICGIKNDNSNHNELIENTLATAKGRGRGLGKITEGSQRYKFPVIPSLSPDDIMYGTVTRANTVAQIWKLLKQ